MSFWDGDRWHRDRTAPRSEALTPHRLRDRVFTVVLSLGVLAIIVPHSQPPAATPAVPVPSAAEPTASGSSSVAAASVPSSIASPQPKRSASPGPTRTATPTATQPPAPAGGRLWPKTGARAYNDASAWNTPIPSSAAVDSHSAKMIATIAPIGVLRSDPGKYTYPVYFAGESTPRITLQCSGLCSTVALDGRRLPSTSSMTIPLPAGVRPSAGTDGQVIIIDQVSGDEFDLYQFDPSTRSAVNASRYVAGVYRDGTPGSYISRGAGVPYLAGLVRPWEIAAGHIDHALAFGYPSTRANRCVYPATKTDGDSISADAIPQGARIRLDPKLDVNSIAGLDRTGRILARALQKYGAVLVDSSGSNKLYVESSLTASWSGVLDASTPSAIPVNRLQVVALPSAYSATSYSPNWGDCIR